MPETVLDVRGLPPPEPLEQLLDALGVLASGDRLRLLIDIEPRPLYPMLERNDLAHRTEPGPVSGYEVTIWPRAGG
jgi:uncharacterized protein (DUF2249 family)